MRSIRTTPPVQINWTALGLQFPGQRYTQELALALQAVKVKELPTGAAGEVLEVILVELAVQLCPVRVYIAPGNLIRHKCGRTYSHKEWVQRPVRMHMLQSLSGVEIPGEMRVCGCGLAVGFSGIELVNANELVNIRTWLRGIIQPN